MPAPEDKRRETDSGRIAHLTWTQIGTALNTLGVFVAIALGAIALGIAVNNSDTTKVVTQVVPPGAAGATPNPSDRSRRPWATVPAARPTREACGSV